MRACLPINAVSGLSGDTDLPTMRLTCFDEHFKDLKAFKAEFGHCNVPATRSNNNKNYSSLGKWCSDIRRSYRAIQEGQGKLYCKLSKADIKRFEKAGFEWRLKI
jgi:hypothetical protein